MKSSFPNTIFMKCRKDFITEKTFDYKMEYVISPEKIPCHIGSVGLHTFGSSYWMKRKGVDNYLFHFVRGGDGVLQYEGKQYSLKEGDMYILRCKNYHELKTGKSGFFQQYFFYFTGDFASDYYDICYENGFEVVNAKNPEYVTRLMEKLFLCAKTMSKSNNLIATNTIFEIFAELAINISSDKSTVEEEIHQPLISQAIEYIETNSHKKISIDDLAQMAHLSGAHFIRMFKKHTGVTPYDYILRVRINKAKGWLQNTDATINRISFETGFSSPNHFVEKFKSIVGVTPNVFRKNIDLWNL